MGHRGGFRPRRRAAALAAIALLAAAPSAGDRWDFEGDLVGAPPKGFTAEVGRWQVADGGGTRVLAQKAESPKPAFNVALADGTSFRDKANASTSFDDLSAAALSAP